jgi:hypothetical protein
VVGEHRGLFGGVGGLEGFFDSFFLVLDLKKEEERVVSFSFSRCEEFGEKWGGKLSLLSLFLPSA